MRLKVTHSKNAASLYVIKDIIKESGSKSTKIVEKLGTYADLKAKLGDEDPYEWAERYISVLNNKEKEGKKEILVKYSPVKLIERNTPRTFNGGYLFLQKIYHDLGLTSICETISKKYKYKYNLDEILSRLVYGRILYPSSKLSTYIQSKKFIEQPEFTLHQIYRALEVISKESDFIQSELYKNSLKIYNRNKSILYYDCTNYYFEIEESDGDKQYGPSKENRPNPIVQMGLFMDGDGIPLAFCINAGNTNEQITLLPLEEKIISDFNLSKFIVSTDAGLASINNRKFNNIKDRAFITTQSLKKLKKYLKEWALDPKDWKLSGTTKTFDIEQLDSTTDFDKIYFKQRWIKEDGLEQKIIVTFSLKYQNYNQKIRNNQIERAMKAMATNTKNLSKTRSTDYKRFIVKDHCTKEGEIAEKEIYSLNEKLIEKEAMYDGFYAVCTNLEDDPAGVIEINRKRWEIEESFRIMKSEFKARPVFLRNDDRIQAHFTTCFISLLIYRLLEKKLGEEHTCREIITGLREMNFMEVPHEGYVPLYTRNDLTDALHTVHSFRLDYQIINTKSMKKIIKDTKK